MVKKYKWRICRHFCEGFVKSISLPAFQCRNVGFTHVASFIVNELRTNTHTVLIYHFLSLSLSVSPPPPKSVTMNHRSDDIGCNIVSCKRNQYQWKIKGNGSFLRVYCCWNVWRRSVKYTANGSPLDRQSVRVYWTTRNMCARGPNGSCI